MPRPRKPSDAVRFQTGAKVRVKSGIRVPDFSDIPLGGWSGTITEVDAKPPVTFLIKWDRRTLELMHPVYHKRCERDGFEMETMWLGEEDIEPDDGTPVPIEQPTQIKTPPLSEKDQDDRVRMALGLTHDDPLPEVNRKTLLAYYRYLAANLKFPFKGKDRKRRHDADRQPTDRPQAVRAGGRGRAALRSSGSSGVFYRPAIGT